MAKKTSSSMDILGWLNLGLTIITGVILAIFFNYRSEKLQRDLIEIQINAEQQQKYAHIDFMPCDSIFDCGVNKLTIKNKGPATAENVKLVVSFEDIHALWFFVHSTGDTLDIRISPPTIDAQIEFDPEKVSYKINFDELTPNSTATITVFRKYTPATEIYFGKIGYCGLSEEEKKYLFENEQDLGLSLFGFTNDNHWKVKWKVFGSCSNCEGEAISEIGSSSEIVAVGLAESPECDLLIPYAYLKPIRTAMGFDVYEEPKVSRFLFSGLPVILDEGIEYDKQCVFTPNMLTWVADYHMAGFICNP